MTQMVQQIAAGQNAAAQNMQTGAAQSSQSGDEFRTLMRSAVDAAKKDDPKAETEEKTEKTEDSDHKNTAAELLQAQAPLSAVLFPLGGVPAETPAQQAADPGSAAADGLLAASGALQKIASNPAAQEVGTQNVRADVSSAVPAGASSVSVGAAKPESAEQGAASEKQAAVSAESLAGGAETAAGLKGAQQAESVSDSAALLQSSVSAMPEKDASGVKDTAEPAETVPEALANPEASAKTELPPQSRVHSAGKSQPDRTEEEQAKVLSPQSTQPREKTETGADKGQAASVSDLYAGGNVVVKISDAKTVQKPSAVRQVAQTAVQQLKQGKKEFEVELYPQSLGKVSVKLSSENGILTVEIMASNPKTQSLLLSGSEDIRSMLQSSTGQNVNLIQAEQSGGWYARQNDGGSGRNQQGSDEQEQRENDAWRKIRNIGTGGVSGMDTGSFLSLMQRAAQ